MATRLHSFKIRNSAFNVPLVVLQTILCELQVKTRAENNVLHPSALWLWLQMKHRF